MSRRALFLDRDGTLIVDVGYPNDPTQVELVPGAAAALLELQREWTLVVVSNQSGVGRGKITPEQANAVHDRFVAAFAACGVAFAGFYYCPHTPEANCACRKPSPGLLLDAAEDLGIELTRSIMIGDKASDVEAGRAAGCLHVVRFGPGIDGRDVRPAGSAAEGRRGSIDDAPASTQCDDWESIRGYLASRS